MQQRFIVRAYGASCIVLQNTGGTVKICKTTEEALALARILNTQHPHCTLDYARKIAAS